MLETFITREMLAEYMLFVAFVFAIVQFTKEIEFKIFGLKISFKNIATRVYAFVVAFLLYVYAMILFDTFIWLDLPLYAITAIIVSSTSNGIYDLSSLKNKLKTPAFLTVVNNKASINEEEAAAAAEALKDSLSKRGVDIIK